MAKVSGFPKESRHIIYLGAREDAAVRLGRCAVPSRYDRRVDCENNDLVGAMDLISTGLLSRHQAAHFSSSAANDPRSGWQGVYHRMWIVGERWRLVPSFATCQPHWARSLIATCARFGRARRSPRRNCWLRRGQDRSSSSSSFDLDRFD